MENLRFFETEADYKNASIEYPNVSYTKDSEDVWVDNHSNMIIMTSESNPVAMEICYNQGWAANPDYMTKGEAEAVTNIGTAFAYGNSNYGYGNQNTGSLTTFHELKYFTSLTTLEDGAFDGNNELTEISIPKNITLINDYALGGYSTKMFFNKIYFYPIKAPYLSSDSQYYAGYTLFPLRNTNGTLYYPKYGVNYDKYKSSLTNWTFETL